MYINFSFAINIFFIKISNYCMNIEYSNVSNDYIYTILKNPNETNIGLINIKDGIIEVNRINLINLLSYIYCSSNNKYI